MECSRCEGERWAQVNGFERYQISDHGRVRGQSGRLMSPSKLRRGHLRIALCRGGKRFMFQVHHLVLLSFVGPRPDGYEGLHNNDDPADNCFKNLRWGTHSENMRDAVLNNRMPRVHDARLREEVIRAVAKGEAVLQVAARHQIPHRTVYDWLREREIMPPKTARFADIRERVLQETEDGAAVKAMVTKYEVSERVVYKWLAQARSQDD